MAVEYKVCGTESELTGEVHTWITRDGFNLDLEDIHTDLLELQQQVEDQRAEIERLRQEIERLKAQLSSRDGWEKQICDQVEEIERLKAALAASCDENRSVALAEPSRTATCPLEQELRGEIERLKRLNATYVADHGEAQDQLQHERDEAREAARWCWSRIHAHIEACRAIEQWPWLKEVDVCLVPVNQS